MNANKIFGNDLRKALYYLQQKYSEILLIYFIAQSSATCF